MSMKNSNDAIGYQTLNLPACRAVPQPTAYHSFDTISMKCSKLLNFEDGTDVVLQRQYGIATVRCVISQKSADFNGKVYIPHAYLTLPQLTLHPIRCEKHRPTAF